MFLSRREDMIPLKIKKGHNDWGVNQKAVFFYGKNDKDCNFFY